MDTPFAQEAEPRLDEAAKIEKWFPAATFGQEAEAKRREWMDQQFGMQTEGFLIDPDLLRFIIERGRMPGLEDGRKPWEYKGWMLYVVQQLHERVAHYRWLQEFCTYTGEEMPVEWKRRPDPTVATSKRSKKSADGGAVLGAPMIVPRWHYLLKTFRAGRLLDEPIPEIHFYASHEAQPGQVMKQIEKWVVIVERDGTGWSALTAFVEWFGWALGVHDKRPKLSDRTLLELYQVVDIVPIMEWPSDYLGTMASLRFGGGPHAFFPTPHSVVELMSNMVSHDVKLAGRDPRAETVLDCCLGTGRMLLHASNYSLRLFGQDIDWVVLLIAKINLALYAPWGIAPLPEEYFSETPPGPPWQLAAEYQRDVFMDEHLRYYRRLWSLEQLGKMMRGMAPDETPKLEQPELDATIDAALAAIEDGEPFTPPAPAPVIPPEALAVPGIVTLSAPNEQRRNAPADAEPISLKGVQLGLFGGAPEPSGKKRGQR